MTILKNKTIKQTQRYFYRFIISSSKTAFLRKKLKDIGILVEKPITSWIKNI